MISGQQAGVPSQKSSASLGDRITQLAGLVRMHPLRALAACIVLAGLAYVGYCPFVSGDGLSLAKVEEVCHEHGLQRRFPQAEPERVEVVGHALLRTDYTTDTRLDPIWDLTVYHDVDGTAWALAAHWWFEPGLQPPPGAAFEPARMGPLELGGLGVYRMTAALKELELLHAQGNSPEADVLLRRTAVLQNLLKHVSGLVVKSKYVSAELPHPDFPTGGFYEYEVGRWVALSYHSPALPAPGDYGTPYVMVQRSLPH